MANHRLNGSAVKEIVDPSSNTQIEDPTAREKWPHLLGLLDPRYEGEVLLSKGAHIKLTPKGSFWEMKVVLPSYKKEFPILVVSLVDACETFEAAFAAGKARCVPTWDAKEGAGKKRKPSLE